MLTLNQGNAYKLNYIFVNKDQSPKDLSGTTSMQYKLAQRKTTTPIISFTLGDPEITITDAAAGKVTIALSEEYTKLLNEGTYYHELRQVNALNEPTTLLAENISASGKLIKE